MNACIHCAGRGEVYDNTCGAWEPCPARCEAWRRIQDEHEVLDALEATAPPEVCRHGYPVTEVCGYCGGEIYEWLFGGSASFPAETVMYDLAQSEIGYTPSSEPCEGIPFHEVMFEADHEPEYKER